ncbi:hypothetical protein SAMN04489761_1586 [Tenacibaculum sp. MAR_2009_124]|uniref:hypothetical protein n=1 Tax=Tenacibaculum sp. MAR_2009_124 TaxID=1250059 RepID=UPI00089B1FFE|nr:hypothetical protein [Tenacibaculum sp. MAR_2009_124]SEB72877.1 hypothetical protein SAMN04489761_1586 [Tenacibaculum sp. MAR_2009_124]
MKLKILYALLFVTNIIVGQIDANSLMGLPTATNTEMTSLTGVNIGSILFNTTDEKVYRYTSAGWQVDTDDQNASEVNVVTAVDVNNVTGDPGAGNELTVEEVVQAIAPITSKAARVFYPPSIAIDASSNGTFTLNLYNEYTAQFATPVAGSTGAPNAIPTYAATDLYYYVTFADTTVFNTGTMSIDANGVLTYTIIGQPTDLNALINVVFVVK